MELDELKATWQSLDRRLAQHNQINLQLFRDRKADKVRGSLRPLFWGQLVQIVFGILFVLLACLLWMRASAQPGGLALGTLIAGIVVHVYGVATIAMAGETLRRINAIDYAAPVVAIQKQLVALRRTYVINGMIAGLPWWFLWVPGLMVLLGLGGAVLHASVVWSGLGVGAAGLLATWWFHRWSRNPERPRLAKAMEDSVTGGSLRKAQQILDEIAQFEKE